MRVFRCPLPKTKTVSFENVFSTKDQPTLGDSFLFIEVRDVMTDENVEQFRRISHEREEIRIHFDGEYPGAASAVRISS